MIERKPYFEDCSEEVKQAIRDRVKIIKNNILYYKEMPVPCEYPFDLFGEELDRISKDFDRFYLLVDLSDTDPPDAKVRQFIKEFFGGFERLQYVAAFTEKNFFLNMAARLVLGKIPDKKFSVHRKYQDALTAIEIYIDET